MRLRRPGQAVSITGAVFLAVAAAAAPSAGAAKEATHAATPSPVPRSVPEPSGYRMQDYKGPTPSTLTGGRVLDTAQAKRLHDAGVPFIDVLPRAPKPKGLPKGTIWRPEPRKDIPGSIWLVDTGYGALAPTMQAYFLDGLKRATKGDKSRPIVFYCKRHCWMSYNAARRAIAAGYTSVDWYPDGTNGWAEAGYALQPNEPQPRPDE
ncbi:PQQ-dependent catabolism-associated CXXCW motif protein [Jiella sp. M17.18]|uniref:PQQ-dependent catabolism-associated CXXCW motif protein n=1 Tax=Jiella sp. M17.18 TaxID=3234247 RepID=UPI0034DF6925